MHGKVSASDEGNKQIEEGRKKADASYTESSSDDTEEIDEVSSSGAASKFCSWMGPGRKAGRRERLTALGSQDRGMKDTGI